MAPRAFCEAWESITNHDDVNVTTVSLLPILFVVIVVFLSALHAAWVEDPTLRDPTVQLAIHVTFYTFVAIVGSVTQWAGGPIKLLEQLAPPRQVVARRRAPQVYKQLLCGCWRRLRRLPTNPLPQGDSSRCLKFQAPGPVPALNVLIMIVGTHGDVAPFVSFAHELRRRYGHRVRFATHVTHRDYVLKEGLDFYPLAGDPRMLSQWMVQSQGRLLPDVHAPLTKLVEEVSEIFPAKVAMVNDIMESTWPACVDELPEEAAAQRPRFVPHAIISNPVTYGHIHCASALNIPLHMAFPQPWTPTAEYPHPFVTGTSMPNRITFSAFDQLTMMGLHVNHWRTETLNLPPILGGERGAHVLNDLRVPFSYMWSSALSEKPADWGEHIDVVGTLVHDAATASGYEPAPELIEFLKEGPAPVFVGFGSMVIDDPGGLFRMLAEAVERTEVRMIVQSSWSKLGGDEARATDRIHLVGACPHSWLLPRCSAVIHHGGAGTVAAGIRFGLPTFIVPFFGDQHFWGDVVASAGAGPPPCPYKELSTERIVDALEHLRTPSARKCAAHIAKEMSHEDGVAALCDSFTRNLPIPDMVCSASLFATEEPRVVVAEKWHPGARLKLSQEAHAALQASSLADAFCCDYGYVLWDTHAPAFVGNGIFMLFWHFAQGILGVLLVLPSPVLEVVYFLHDWRRKGGRDGAVNVVCSAVVVFCFACLSVPWLLLRRTLDFIVKFYMGLMEYLLQHSRLWKRRLVHVRARHQCIRPAVGAGDVPQERRGDLVRAAIVAEHVLGVVALVQHRSRGKVRTRLTRRDMLRVLYVLSRCPPPEQHSNCFVRGARRAMRLWVYLQVLCGMQRPDEASLFDGWESEGPITLIDFCLRYGQSLRRAPAAADDGVSLAV